MQVYNYQILRIKGKRNEVADLLSRRPTWFTDGKQGNDDAETHDDVEPDDDDSNSSKMLSLKRVPCLHLGLITRLVQRRTVP